MQSSKSRNRLIQATSNTLTQPDGKAIHSRKNTPADCWIDPSGVYRTARLIAYKLFITPAAYQQQMKRGNPNGLPGKMVGTQYEMIQAEYEEWTAKQLDCLNQPAFDVTSFTYGLGKVGKDVRKIAQVSSYLSSKLEDSEERNRVTAAALEFLDRVADARERISSMFDYWDIDLVSAQADREHVQGVKHERD
jgi:hypothetical protein